MATIWSDVWSPGRLVSLTHPSQAIEKVESLEDRMLKSPVHETHPRPFTHALLPGVISAYVAHCPMLGRCCHYSVPIRLAQAAGDGSEDLFLRFFDTANVRANPGTSHTLAPRPF